MKALGFALFTLAVLVAGVFLGTSGKFYAYLPEVVQAYLPAPVHGVARRGEPPAREILYWVAPMDPSYRRDKPGKSPMGMDLVPVYADNAGTAEDTSVVKISPAVVDNLGVRTARVECGTLWRRIDTTGYVDVDETRISHIHLRTEGWVERLRVKSEGERVKQGQLLFELYSPDLVNAQEEFIQALATDNPGLIRASKERLFAMGMAPAQIKQFTRTRQVSHLVQTYAPQAGILSALNIREGTYVKPATTTMSLVDLSSVWLLAEVFEHQAGWVAVGQAAEARLAYRPGEVWKGKVAFIYPELDPMTRTLKVRLRFDNPGEHLKPNMYAQVTLYSGPKRDVLIIPREALIRSGQGERVVLALGEGRFQSRKVTAGIESGDQVEVIAGLSEGDRVVTSAQFLIDSEASLKESFARMEGAQTGVAEATP